MIKLGIKLGLLDFPKLPVGRWFYFWRGNGYGPYHLMEDAAKARSHRPGAPWSPSDNAFACHFILSKEPK